jgi:hypothetical protein
VEEVWSSPFRTPNIRRQRHRCRCLILLTDANGRCHEPSNQRRGVGLHACRDVAVGAQDDPDRGVAPGVLALPVDAPLAVNASVAQVCLSPCSGIGGSPALAACSANVRLNRSGCSGPPSGRQNTSP